MRTQQAISVVTVPPVEPFTLAVCKEWLKVDSDITADDVLIATLITAARQYVEKICNRALVITTFDLTVDQFPGGATIVIPRSQLIAVTSIAYIDMDGASQTLAASVYDVDAKSTPGRVSLAYGQSWAATRDQINAVTVRFTAGYAPDESGSPADFTANIPDTITLAMRQLINHWYVNRDSVIVGSINQTLKVATDMLLANERVKTEF